MSINVTIQGCGTGTDTLTGKTDSEGLTVSFENEAPCFVSWKSFKQLLSFKTAQTGKPVAKPEVKPVQAAMAVPVGNGVK